MRNLKYPTKKPRFSEKKQYEDKIKAQLKLAFDHWKYWKFQIHWGNLKYLMPIKCDTKISFVCLLINYF